MNTNAQPEWESREVIEFEMPTTYYGESVMWAEGYRPEPQFVSQFAEESATVYLFALQFDLRHTENKVMGGRGSFLHFLCVHRDGAKDVVQQLQQIPTAHSVAYSTPISILDRDVSRDPKPDLPAIPAWKWNDAVWPEVDGIPMKFVGQSRLPDNLSAETAYLFSSDSGEDLPDYAVLRQENDYQSAEDHYADEMS